MRCFTSSSVFPFPFNHTSEGLWRKYPNQYTPHVVTVDTLARTLDVKTGVLRTERIIGIKQSAPRWLVRLIGVPDKAFVREVTFVVPSTSQGTPPQILMASINLSLSNIVNVKERISYTPCQDGTGTLFRQQALINAVGKFNLDGKWRSIGERIEGWSLDRFASNAHIGRMALTSVLEALLETTGESRTLTST